METTANRQFIEREGDNHPGLRPPLHKRGGELLTPESLRKRTNAAQPNFKSQIPNFKSQITNHNFQSPNLLILKP